MPTNCPADNACGMFKSVTKSFCVSGARCVEHLSRVRKEVGEERKFEILELFDIFITRIRHLKSCNSVC